MDRELMDLAALVRRYPIEKHELPQLPEYPDDRNHLTFGIHMLPCVIFKWLMRY